MINCINLKNLKRFKRVGLIKVNWVFNIKIMCISIKKNKIINSIENINKMHGLLKNMILVNNLSGNKFNFNIAYIKQSNLKKKFLQILMNFIK